MIPQLSVRGMVASVFPELKLRREYLGRFSDEGDVYIPLKTFPLFEDITCDTRVRTHKHCGTSPQLVPGGSGLMEASWLARVFSLFPGTLRHEFTIITRKNANEIQTSNLRGFCKITVLKV